MIILLIIALVVFVVKMIGFAAKLTWGLTKSIFSIAFLPIAILVMILTGLVKIALPIALIAVILIFILPKIKK